MDSFIPIEYITTELKIAKILNWFVFLLKYLVILILYKQIFLIHYNYYVCMLLVK